MTDKLTLMAHVSQRQFLYVMTEKLTLMAQVNLQYL